jgi:myosin-3
MKRARSRQDSHLQAVELGAEAAACLDALTSPDGTLDLFHPIQGKVFRGQHSPSGRPVAVKVAEYAKGDVEEEDVLAAEILIAKLLGDHDHIVKFLGAHRTTKPVIDRYGHETGMWSVVWIVTELCLGSGADLSKRITSYLQQPEADYALVEHLTATVVKHTLQGLVHMHSKNVIHRDVKAANVLFSTDNVIKLADFDIAMTVEGKTGPQSVANGTPHWMAPEVCACEYSEGYAYDHRCDLWSLGILAIELVEGRPPHHDNNSTRVIDVILSQPAPILTLSDKWSLGFKDFLQKCLIKDFE